MKLGRYFAIFLFSISTAAMAAEPQGSRAQGTGAAAPPGGSEFAASMEKMHAAMASVEPSGNLDTDFVRLMLPHHQAAIDMAKSQLLYGKDPQILRLAQEIIIDQQSEIELMQLWLKQHEPSAQKQNQPPAPQVGKEP